MLRPWWTFYTIFTTLVCFWRDFILFCDVLFNELVDFFSNAEHLTGASCTRVEDDAFTKVALDLFYYLIVWHISLEQSHSRKILECLVEYYESQGFESTSVGGRIY